MINHLHKYHVDLSILKFEASWMLVFLPVRWKMTKDDDDGRILLSAWARKVQDQVLSKS